MENQQPSFPLSPRWDFDFFRDFMHVVPNLEVIDQIVYKHVGAVPPFGFRVASEKVIEGGTILKEIDDDPGVLPRLGLPIDPYWNDAKYGLAWKLEKPAMTLQWGWFVHGPSSLEQYTEIFITLSFGKGNEDDSFHVEFYAGGDGHPFSYLFLVPNEPLCETARQFCEGLPQRSLEDDCQGECDDIEESFAFQLVEKAVSFFSRG